MVGIGALVLVEWLGAGSDRRVLTAQLVAADSAISRALADEAERVILAARALAASSTLHELVVFEAAPSSAPRPIDAWLEGAAADLGVDSAAIFSPAGRLVASLSAQAVEAQNPDTQNPDTQAPAAFDSGAVSGWGSASGLELAGDRLRVFATTPAVERFDPVAVVRVGRVIDDRRIRSWAGSEADALLVVLEGDQARSLAGTAGPEVVAALLEKLELGSLLAARGKPAAGDSPLSDPVEISGVELQARKGAIGVRPGGRVVARYRDLMLADQQRGLLVVFADLSALGRQRDPLFLGLVGLVAGALLLTLGSSLALGARRTWGIRRLERWLAAPTGAIGEIPRDLSKVRDLLEQWQTQRAGERALGDRVALAVAKEDRASPEDRGEVAPREGMASGDPAPGESRIWVGLELRVRARSASVAGGATEGQGEVHADPERERQERPKQGDWLAAARSVLAACGGQLEGRLGSRIVATFSGSGSAHRAVTAISEIGEHLRSVGFGSIAASIVEQAASSTPRGDAVESRGHGPAPRLESLLREAQDAEILISEGLVEVLAGALDDAGIELRERLGLFELSSLQSLSAQQAGRLASGLAAYGENERAARERGEGVAPGPVALLSAGTMIADRFEIWSWHGVSTQAVEYQAWDWGQERRVLVQALKRGVWLAPLEHDRLVRNMAVARRFDHPNVFRVVDFLEQQEGALVVTETRSGIRLRDLIDRIGRLPVNAGVLVAGRLCSALAAAHRAGLLHLDLGADKVWLGTGGEVKIADFGIAQPRLRERGKVSDGGLLVGGVDYLAPEQIDGPTPDTRSDVYAWGGLVYEAFCGRRPFEAATPMEVLRLHLEESPPSPLRWAPHLPAELEIVLLTCLAKSPEDRYHDGEELEAAWHAVARRIVATDREVGTKG